MLGDLCSLRGTSVAFQEVGKQMCAFLDLLAVQRQVTEKNGESLLWQPDGLLVA